MADASTRPVAPGGPSAIRVRHRGTRREGRLSGEAAQDGHLRILFDGEPRPRTVPAQHVEYLDARAQPGS